MQTQSVSARTHSEIPSQLLGEAMDRERLFDLIVRFRLRPVRRIVGRFSAGRQPVTGKFGASRGPAKGMLERFERGVIIIDAAGRVLFVNRTAESLLDGSGDLDVTTAGHLRFATDALQQRLVEYLIASRRTHGAREPECDAAESLVLCAHPVAGAGPCQIAIAPLLYRPVAQLLRRCGPLHAVFVYAALPKPEFL